MCKMDAQTINVINEILTLFESRHRFLIVTHVNPDGDGITSGLAVSAILYKYNKEIQFWIDDKLPQKFDFLYRAETVSSYNPDNKDFDPEVIVILDSSGLDRIGRIADFINEKHIIVNIDHHTSNTKFGNINYIDDCASSTVELTYNILKALKFPVHPELATLIYTGIISDTGRFIFPNTTSQSLAVCSEMVRCGASPALITEKMYNRVSFETIYALGKALSSIELHFDKRVASMYLTDCKFEPVETEGFVDQLLRIDGTEVEFFMREIKPNQFRISFRSKFDFDVNQLAHKFGGGGHARAAGCSIAGSCVEVKNLILSVLEEHFDDSKNA